MYDYVYCTHTCMRNRDVDRKTSTQHPLGRECAAPDPSGPRGTQGKVFPDMGKQEPIGEAAQTVGQRGEREGGRDEIDPPLHRDRPCAAVTRTRAACLARPMTEMWETLAAAVAP